MSFLSSPLPFAASYNGFDGYISLILRAGSSVNGTLENARLIITLRTANETLTSPPRMCGHSILFDGILRDISCRSFTSVEMKPAGRRGRTFSGFVYNVYDIERLRGFLLEAVELFADEDPFFCEVGIEDAVLVLLDESETAWRTNW